MNDAVKPSPLRTLGLVYLGLFALLLVVAGIAVITWRSSTLERMEAAKREGELYRQDALRRDATRARYMARGGLARLQVELRQGRLPADPLRGVFGSSYMDGEDRYEGSYRELSEGVYAVEITGQVTMKDWGTSDADAQNVVGECVIEARVQVDGDAVSVLSLEATDTSPERPRSD